MAMIHFRIDYDSNFYMSDAVYQNSYRVTFRSTFRLYNMKLLDMFLTTKTEHNW